MLLLIASPVSIPIRSYAFQRPMRNSIEGLNQEIEKLVLIPGQPHTCRPESSHVSYGAFLATYDTPTNDIFLLTLCIVCSWFT